MDKYHHHHISRYVHLRHFLHDRYNDLLVSDTFRQFSLSMISLFVPIFLLKSGYSILEITLLEIAMFISIIFLHFFVLHAIARLGVKRTLIISYIFNIIFYLLLYNTDNFIGLSNKTLFLVIIGVFNILPTALYWSAHHVFFFKSTDSAHAGAKIGLLFCLPTLIGIISPYLGSVLITKYDFRFVFLLSAVLLVAASFSLLFSENIEVKTARLNLKKILDLKHIRKNIIFFIQGVSFAATSFIWPILLFLSSIKLTAIGGLYLISSFIYSIVGFLAGKRSDKKSSRNLVALSSIGHGISIIMRGLTTSLMSIVVWQSLGGLFGGVKEITLESKFYKYTRDDIINSIMNRELFMYLGRIFILTVFLVAFIILNDNRAFVFGLVIAGIITFFLSLVVKNDNYFTK